MIGRRHNVAGKQGLRLSAQLFGKEKAPWIVLGGLMHPRQSQSLEPVQCVKFDC